MPKLKLKNVPKITQNSVPADVDEPDGLIQIVDKPTRLSVGRLELLIIL